MKKLTSLLLAVLLTSNLLFAQTVADAKKSLTNGRIATAKETLQKLVAANNKNGEAIYWLGQAYLTADDVAGAKKVYQDALNNGVNDPYLWVGMGHVSLLENNKADARQRFEAAITASINKKKENPAILTAIGRANADGGLTIGDPAYGIEKLKKAIEIDPNNADAYVNLGINYIKQNDGTNAYDAYSNALRIEPNNANANFRMGKIFQSQDNREKFLEYYNKAITVDAGFAPAYLELYDYYSNRDVNKAGDYLQKYVANSDKDCNTEFLYADYLFRSGKYQESLDKARAMENGACKSYPRLKVLYAYNYDRLGDSVQAKSNIMDYMSTAAPDKISSADYIFAGNLLKKSAGGEESAILYLKKAFDNDTARSNKKQYADTIAVLYKKLGKSAERLDWLKKSFSLNLSPNNIDIFNMADAGINAKDFVLADSMSRFYITKYADQDYGYLLAIRSKKAADTTGVGAFAASQQYIDFLTKKDPTANASKIISQYTFIASTSADILKDYSGALDAVNKILAIEPTNSFANSAKPVLEKAVNNKGGGGATKKPAPATKKGK